MRRIQLNDVMIIRPLAIFLLVVWHSFIIYTGGWSAPAGFQPNECYWWLAKFSYAFMLELFVFISGYVFGLSLERKENTFKGIFINKFKRLIVPSIFFSVVYYFLFYNLENFSIIKCAWNILEGCGHMWFLPMLFWATLITFVIDKLKLSQWFKLVVVFCLPVLSLLPLPLRLSSAMYYIPFFYAGILIYRNRDIIIQKYCKSLIMSLL